MFDPREFFDEEHVKALPVILLLDASGSMSHNNNINTMNDAVRIMIDEFKKVDELEIEIKLAIIKFGGSAVVTQTLEDCSTISYSNLNASGGTPMGGAINEAIKMINDDSIISGKDYRPVVVLVSDGAPTDNATPAINNFINGKRTSKVDRFAMAIGENAKLQYLEAFINNVERKVFLANDAKDIKKFFRFVTMSTIARTNSVNPNNLLAKDQLNDIKNQVF